MSASAQIVVVGCGVLGASTAYHLATQHISGVVLIDRGGPAAGPSGSSSAIVRRNYSNPVTARLALESLRFFQNFSELTGGESGYRKTGNFSLVGHDGTEPLHASIEMQRELGIDIRAVPPDEIRRMEPEISLDGVGAASYDAEGGYADPVLTASGMATRAKELGVRHRLNTEVTAIRVEPGKVAGIETSGGPIDAGSVILACGPWTNRLLAPLGFELPLRVTRHAVCAFERPANFRRHHAVIGDFPNGVYIRTEGEALTLVGLLGSLDDRPEDEVDPDWFPTSSTFEDSSVLGGRLAQRYPTLRDALVRRGWASVYDVTPDKHPIIDAIDEIAGLYVACGTSGHGFKLSPALGRLAAGLVAGGEDGRREAAPFSRARFDTGELLQLHAYKGFTP
jgi:sarcosine oxidase subunit beta